MQQDLDLRGLKYVERNGGCYIDFYKIYLDGTADPFPIETYYSNCYPGHSIRGYNILAKRDEIYRVVACFYFQEHQTVKCQKLDKEPPKFDEYINVECNKTEMINAKNLIFIVGEQQFGTVEIYNDDVKCRIAWINNGYIRGYRATSDPGYILIYKNKIHANDPITAKVITREFKPDMPRYLAFTSIGKFVSLKLNETFYKIEWEGSEPTTVKWRQNFDFIFPLNELENKTLLHVQRKYTGIKYVNGTTGCLVRITGINNDDKNKEIPIDCFPKDAVYSFGMVHDFNGKYRLRTCYLIYENVIPEMTCYFLGNGGKFKKEFDYMFQNCAFVAGYIDDKHCEQYPETLPKIIIKEYDGALYHGITINYYKTSCDITISNGEIMDTEVDGIKIYGYDPIRDSVFTADTLSSYGYNDVEQVFSTGDTLFFKLNGREFGYKENEEKKKVDGDFDAIVDERLFGDKFF
uniref:Uncharacterized protein n=1 Tax=Panagrolaimus sp. JU765 TaxID=591449 RepID=A0AC34RLH8_9BILA